MNLKKILALIFVVTFLISGCGRSEATEDNQSQAPKTEETSTTPTTEEKEVVFEREAANLENGKKVFLAQANCTQCHRGGLNTVIANKHLGQDALEKYNMDSMAAIAQQVRNGKNAMPAYGRRLTDEQIRDVAAYVLDQAEKGWTN
ncbi:c-type cytochrome [Dactylococcopsis salina]|uniref:Cytochrome c, mono-and diheme variants family n=1 Tax=Dactylococcopsis salina (strain PCC 8305) TaxID=13035 RepID=K9YX66_DACS8|nr:c-type cytochrome [Dactylococcopsis salina]AFZ51514.1 cytochrome c, mono- and diheme variants family [Dactylococcopsis salina PCC 8305]